MEESVMQEYKSPANRNPFSREGLLDLAKQCLDAAGTGDSALLEMAGLAIRRLAEHTHSRQHDHLTGPLE